MRFEMWLEAGGVVPILVLLVGYLALQAAAGGTITASDIFKRGAFWLLLPFLFCGSCSRDAYQYSAALGHVGVESSERALRVLGRTTLLDRRIVGSGPDREYEYFDRFAIYVDDPDFGLVDWELPDGSMVFATEIPVPEDFFERYNKGDVVHVVELPGESYPSARLVESAQRAVRYSAIGALLWLLLGGAAVWESWRTARKRKLESQGAAHPGTLN